MNDKVKNLRVLHIMSGFGGGISAFIRNKAQILNDGSVLFDVLTFDEVSTNFDNLIKETGGQVYKISNPKEKGFLKFYKEVDQVMKKLSSETVVHSHVNGTTAIPFYLIAKKNGLHRFVIHAHTAAPSLKNNRVQEKVKKLINRTISKEKLSCGVKASRNIFGEREVKRNKIVHIPNSINYKEFIVKKDTKNLKKEILGISDDRLIIGNIARFRELKNHYFMIKVMEELKNINDDFLCFFAGDGLLKSEIETLVKEKNLTKNVKFLGFREDIDNLFAMMDIFILPSFNEGLPTVVIEAQAASTTSFISDTITKECDLDLGLVKYLPITTSQLWIEGVRKYKEKKLSKKTIEERLVNRKFTNEASADLYLKFLNKKISQYSIK